MLIKDNKGFSLIELIIVIAIMAVLIAVLTPQFLRYVEKSKEGKDREVAAIVQQAITVAMSDVSIDDRPVGGWPTSGTSDELWKLDDPNTPEFSKAIKEYIGTSNLQTFVQDNLNSNAYKGQPMNVSIDSTSLSVVVMVQSNLSGVDDIILD